MGQHLGPELEFFDQSLQLPEQQLMSGMEVITLNGRASTIQQVADLLSLSSAPRPPCGPNQAMVRVRATTINIEDLLHATGFLYYKFIGLEASRKKPVVLGMEFSGHVVETGKDVHDLDNGEEVIGFKRPSWEGGGWAELIAVDRCKLVKKRASLSWAEAAALPLSSQVAWAAVKRAGFGDLPATEDVMEGEVEVAGLGALLLRKGQVEREARVAVVGAGSTIGLMVVTLLARRGVAVVGVCGARSAARVLARGAACVLDRHQGGLGARGDRQFDVVIDCVGGEQVEAMGREVLASCGGGDFVTIVGPVDTSAVGASIITVGLGLLTRTIWSMFSVVKYKFALMAGDMKVVTRLMEEGLTPLIDSEVALEEGAVKVAVERVADMDVIGRIVIVI